MCVHQVEVVKDVGRPGVGDFVSDIADEEGTVQHVAHEDVS